MFQADNFLNPILTLATRMGLLTWIPSSLLQVDLINLLLFRDFHRIHSKLVPLLELLLSISIGGPLSSVGDELVLEIPSNFDPYSSSLHFYCTAHTSMNGQLTVVATGESHGDESEYGYDDNETDPNYDGNESDYGYDNTHSEDERVPVFFLTSSILQELTGEEGLAEGNYAVSEDYEWNEETQSEEFGFWIEPAEESETGDWVYAGGETEDGYLIVESYQGEDLLRQYFDDNQLSEVGQITDYHDEEDESDPINENNQSEYYVPQSIAGALLTAQDENWSVYNEEINFYDNQTFNAVIENDAESPLNASGSYEYSVNSNGSASLFYTVQSDDETNGYSFTYDLVFSTSNQGTYTKTANYNGETDITTGPFTLILDSDDGGSGTGHQNDGNESEDHNDEFTPIEEVEEFVNELKNSIEELTYSDAVWVEKTHDALVDGRFVYEVGLNNMINLYFDQNGSYIHAAEDYMEERQFIPKSEISQSIKDLILAEVPNSEIIDFEVEFSRINVSGNDNKIFFAVIENNQSESFEVVINGDGERVIIVMPFEDIIAAI